MPRASPPAATPIFSNHSIAQVLRVVPIHPVRATQSTAIVISSSALSGYLAEEPLRCKSQYLDRITNGYIFDYINSTQSGPGGYNLILGPTAEAVNIPTVSCGTAGCLSSLSTVLFTELVYTGMVNSTTFPAAYGSISTDYFLPQLTSYFPAGNPLASCTTLSLIEYTPNAQSVLQKRNDINQQNSQTYVWPGANSLTSTSTLTFRAGHSVSLTSTIPPSTTSFSPSTSPTSVSSSTSPTISSHKSSTASRTSTPPSSGIITIGTSTAPIVPPSLTGIGTVTLTQTVYYNISSVENSLPLSGTFVCNTAGCTRASDAGITTNTSGASSISTAANTSTNGAKKLTQPLVRVILAALLLALTGIL